MRIIINENQYSKIFENIEDEGFDFKDGATTMKFNPSHERNADTSIFKPNTKEFNVKKVMLPKSQVMSYNLYDIRQMNVNRGLKHGENVKGIEMDISDPSITNFVRRSALYIKSLLGEKPVDIITYPQSSSSFNQIMTKRLMMLYPNSEGIQLKEGMLVKNVKNIFVNVDAARESGLNDKEIHDLQSRVEGWKQDEDLRDLRNKIQVLKQEIYNLTINRGRGRPSKDFTDRQSQLKLYNKETAVLRKGRAGRDSTKDKDGNTKDWQIKSIDAKHRRSIEGIFDLNPQYQSIQYKFKGKHIIIFDDNLSSGATLDDVCLALQKLGVASITPFTLGVIPETIYDPKERYKNN